MTKPNKPQPFALPRLFDSALLLKQAIPGETIILVLYKDAFNQSAFQFGDSNGRVAIFHFDQKYACHVLRVPASIWNAKRGEMAHAFMQQAGRDRFVILTESPAVEAHPSSKWLWHIDDFGLHDEIGIEVICNGETFFNKSTLPTKATFADFVEAMKQLDEWKNYVFQNGALPVDRVESPKSQCGQEASRLVHTQEIAGSIPATATNLLADPRAAFIAAQVCSDVVQYNNGEFCNAATEGLYQEWILPGKTATGIYPVESETIPPEMDVPGTSKVSSDVVVGQGAEQSGTSASETLSSPGWVETKSWGSVIREKAWSLLENPMRLKALINILASFDELKAISSQDGFDDAVKTALEDPLSTVELGHAGWVKRREPKA